MLQKTSLHLDLLIPKWIKFQMETTLQWLQEACSEQTQCLKPIEVIIRRAQQANQVNQYPRATAKERLIITAVEVTELMPQILIVLHFRVVVAEVRAAQTCWFQLREAAVGVDLRNPKMQAFATEVKLHSIH